MGIAAALSVAGALGLVGCSTVRDDLGTTNSPCYIALPAAASAVHQRGHLDGVRLRSVRSLAGDPLLDAAALGAPNPATDHVCLVAYSGSFDAESVDRPFGASAGREAIVVLTYPDNKLLGTVLTSKPGDHFGHPHLG